MNKRIVFANIIIGIALIFFLVIFVVALYKSISHHHPESMVTYYIVSFIGVVLFICVLKCRSDLKVNIALLLISLAIITYTIELVLSLNQLVFQNNSPTSPLQKRIEFAKAMGLSFDTRSKLQVVMDLRGKGVDAYPVSHARDYIYSDGQYNIKMKIYPLGFISGKTAVVCNENGEYLITNSDEHGFNNPKGLYTKDRIDIILIGDSFANGHCIRPEKNMAGWLRTSGRSILNLGMGANGPLLELATLQEYAKPLKPKYVFWLYYEGNDLVDLKEEKKLLPLMKYLDRDYSQDLLYKQELIDRTIIEYVEDKIAHKKWEDGIDDESNVSEYKLSLSQLVKLSQLRNRYQQLKECFFMRDPDPLFKDIMAEAKSRVNDWGGRLYFVYLPSIDRYSDELNRCSKFSYSLHRKRILSITKELNIPVIDILESLNSHNDPYSLFPYRLKFRGHFNAEGYRLVAQQLIKQLQADENNHN